MAPPTLPMIASDTKVPVSPCAGNDAIEECIFSTYISPSPVSTCAHSVERAVEIKVSNEGASAALDQRSRLASKLTTNVHKSYTRFLLLALLLQYLAALGACFFFIENSDAQLYFLLRPAFTYVLLCINFVCFAILYGYYAFRMSAKRHGPTLMLLFCLWSVMEFLPVTLFCATDKTLGLLALTWSTTGVVAGLGAVFLLRGFAFKADTFAGNTVVSTTNGNIDVVARDSELSFRANSKVLFRTAFVFAAGFGGALGLIKIVAQEKASLDYLCFSNTLLLLYLFANVWLSTRHFGILVGKRSYWALFGMITSLEASKAVLIYLAFNK